MLVRNHFWSIQIGCPNISPGPIVWIDICSGTVCPGRPNVLVTFVRVRTNVWIDICPGEETRLGVTLLLT